MLGVSPDTVRRWARQGLLKGRSDGAEWSFDAHDLERWARAQGLSVRASRPAASPPRRQPLGEALRRGGILRGLRGATPDDVLQSMAAACPLPEGARREDLWEQLKQRERLFSTAIGHGIALPHPRTPSPAFGAEPALVLGFLEQPVAWRSIDQQPVHAVFLILSPTAQQHLQLLSRVAYMLRLPAFVELMARQAPDAEILRTVAEREPPQA